MSAVSLASQILSSSQLPVRQGKRGSRMFEARLHSGLSSAKPAWHSLERQGRCTAFQRFDWVNTIVRYLMRPDTEKVIVVEIFDAATRQPAMLLPLIYRRCPGYRVIQWLNCDVCDYSAPVFTADLDWGAADATAAWDAALKVLPRADILYVDGMPHDVGGTANPLVNLPRVRLSALTTCGFSIDGNPRDVLERCCSASFVRRYRRSVPRLERRGEVRLVGMQTDAEVDAVFSVLLEQRTARFRKLGRFDLLSRPAVAAFYRDAALQGLKGGPVRLHGLRVGDEWVGAAYGLVYGNSYQGLIMTIADEAPWRHASLGIQVHARLVEWARGRGLTYFDMSVGTSAYKDESGGQRRPLFAIDEALTLRGHLILLGLRSGTAFKAWLENKPWIFERLRATRQHLRRLSAKLGDARPYEARR
jgi:CelD/BcsL family acetyltransferase involved in cellulose biosynthesis